ncbi:hypothetical protein [Litorisediminicola beolgyonensis]|uniref:Uncharacterized protein n=1 Tax=Litorisediminicola beolgyonensis TaxID=1173614 RepID=A0ABW3ZDK3_9RHOB
MFRAPIISTLFAAAALQASAEPSDGPDLSILPEEVAARVIELQAHGDRFEDTIRAILAEARKPGWTFESPGEDAGEIAAVAEKE